MFRVDIPDNALKTKVSSKYENSQKKPRWMEQLNKSEAPRVASVQYCEHDVEYGSPSKTSKWYMVRLRKNLTSVLSVSFSVSYSSKALSKFHPYGFHRQFPCTKSTKLLMALAGGRHSWPPKNSRLADFLFDPSVFLGPGPCSICFFEKTKKNAETNVTTTPIYYIIICRDTDTYCLSVLQDEAQTYWQIQNQNDWSSILWTTQSLFQQTLSTNKKTCLFY